ncbi:MAG: type V CRISPR-associated protein Cas12a/Cpf1 [Campylobacterales bacterium]|nr:type V CRISPR-associated protein Cas12a/Cpf1 [Campylobacterales bacterium]
MFLGFINKYQLSKTLRFELKPIGKTLELIEKKGLITEDETRSEDYKRAKELIDEYHKEFIHQALSGIRLGGLDRYEELFFIQNRDEKTQKEFEKLQDDLRKQIVAGFKAHKAFANIDKKELIKVELPEFLTDEKDREIVARFDSFTTYFTGFHENRKNIYSDKAQHSSIGYRVIHENLSIFLANKRAFELVQQNFPEIAQIAQDSLLEHLEGGVVEDMFELDYFSLTLTQKYIDIYNTMLGGKVLEDGTKVQGLNEHINLYRQKHNIEKRKLPNLKALHKQILSDREGMSWLPDAFENRDELNSTVESFYKESIVEFACCDGVVDITEKFVETLSDDSNYDLSKIFVKNDISLTAISQEIFKDYRVIKDALWQKHLADNPKAIKSKDITADEEKYFSRKNSYFSILEIEKALDEAGQAQKLLDFFKVREIESSKTVKESFADWQNNKEDKKLTKSLLDSMLNLQRAIKPLFVKAEIDKDIAFYASFDTYFESLSGIVKLYDKVRNFESKKPYSLEKFKLNFENSTLLDGWDLNKEPDNTSVLFKKDGLFYLGIMDKKHNKIFTKISENNSKDIYQKIEYKLLPGANKMLPKVFFSNKNIDYYAPSEALLANYRDGVHKKGDNFDLDFCHELIDFFKSSIEKHPDWRNFEFSFSDTSSYEDMSGFYREVEQQGYKISYKDIDSSYIDQLVDDGKLYLFQIYNKDFSPYSKGTPNMHTLYWKMLFDETNLKDVVYKLNGQAEIFYRKKSIEYSKEKMLQGHHYDKLKDKFAYPIIKDRRFAMDKFQFHVPITLNFKAVGSDRLNDDTNELIRTNRNNIKVIGIDRGERHLLYLSLIDSSGRIVEQYSLNQIINSHNGKKHIVDYHQKLADKEKERAEARENWGVVENIKELKEGYMSHVIHRIATLMVKHNAIVALEDLNFGFKRGRFKVEKQVYQKFEKMLIDKLNYLVDKQKSPNELGGLLKAFQLTNKFVSFEKLGKQSGFLFYVPAWNTSKIDPVTGFVNLLDTRYQSIEKSKEFFSKFDAIRYNDQKGYFEFEFDYKNFTTKADGTRTKWTLCTYGTRIKTFRNRDKNHQWDNVEVDLTAEFKSLFGLHSGDLKELIISQDRKEFFETLLYLLRLTLQMRNSVTNSEIDYLISPVADKNGNFYDSRVASDDLPRDADANGAYNIARKGLMIIEKIAKSKSGEKLNLTISNKEWLAYAQR